MRVLKALMYVMNRVLPEFDRFVSASTPALLRAAFLVVQDQHEAEDIVQETFMRLAKRWPRVRRMNHPAAYARRVMLNLALDGSPKRRRRREELAEQLPELPGAEDVETRLDTYDDIVRALAALAPRQRAVLVLRYFLDLSEAETADALQCSLGTVKSTASRGLVRLQEALPPTLSRSIRT